MQDPFAELKSARTALATKRDALRANFGRLEFALRQIIEDKYSEVDPYSGEAYLTLHHAMRPEEEHVVTLRCCGEWWLEIGISDRLPEEDSNATYRGFYATTNLRTGYHKSFAENVNSIRGILQDGEDVVLMRWNGKRRDRDDSMDMYPLKVESLVSEFLHAAATETSFDLKAYNPR